MLVQGREQPIVEPRKWHHYDPAKKHMVTKIESGERVPHAWKIGRAASAGAGAVRAAWEGGDATQLQRLISAGEDVNVCDETGLPSDACSGPCPVNNYCDEGSTLPSPCLRSEPPTAKFTLTLDTILR